MDGRVLIVGASDSSAGAGIQADLKTITGLGAQGATAITVLTAPDTSAVCDVFPVPPPFIACQMRAVLEAIGADCVKTGMLCSAEVVEVVVRSLERYARTVPLVVDPMMVGRGGRPRLDGAGLAALKLRLLPVASLVTANAIQAELLTGVAVGSAEDLSRAADGLLALGAGAAYVQGAGDGADEVVDLLRTADGDEVRFEGGTVDSSRVHGASCTLASAVAASVAQGLRLADALSRARDYVSAAKRHASTFASGSLLLDHTHPGRPDDQDITS
jgi:hydroxymethylpyrimidine/phosphomethylpyrimidine kinase